MANKVGTKDGWYVGDRAYVWRKDGRIPEFSGTFSRWVGGEITALFDDGSLILKTGEDLSGEGLKLASSTAAVYTKTAAYAVNDGLFPVGTKVVLLTPFPQIGILGTVITLGEAQQGGAKSLDMGIFIPVKLDRGYAGGWYPESLGIIADSVAVPPETELKNNDGRSKCFWCNAPTKVIELAFSIGNVCTQCGR